MSSVVSRVVAAEPKLAEKHFADRLAFETGCWDVHHAISNDKQDFVLLDVRSEEFIERDTYQPQSTYLIGILTPAISHSIPMTRCSWCTVPAHIATGLTKVPWRWQNLVVQSKEMIGGAIGWTDEGFDLVCEESNEATANE